MFFNKKIGYFGAKLNENMAFVLGNDFSYLPQIFSVFSEEHEKSKQVAATFLKDILEKFSFNDMIKIDVQMRQATLMEWFTSWSKIKKSDLLLLTMSKEEKQAVLVFASLNPNGYMREKAVKLLAKYDMSLPYILLRKNDWVRQVREAANKSFIYRMDHLSEGELLASLPFAEKMNRSLRVDHKSTMIKFYDILLNPINKNELEFGLASQNLYTRRFCLNAILNADKPDMDLILKQTKSEKIPQIKFTAYKKLLTLNNCPVDIVLGQMLIEKYPRTKSHALQYIYEHNTLNSYNIAIDFLLDKSTSVRSTARWIIFSCNKEFDFVDYYKINLSTNPYSSISGIRETGKKNDAVLIESYLSSDVVSIVRITMRALMFLDAMNYGLHIVKMLEDSREGVIKEAFQLLRNYGISSYGEEIYRIFKNSENADIRYKCATLLFRSTKWESIIYILEALSNQDKVVRELSETALYDWTSDFNSSFTKPNLIQKQKISQLLIKQSSFISQKSSLYNIMNLFL